MIWMSSVMFAIVDRQVWLEMMAPLARFITVANLV